MTKNNYRMISDSLRIASLRQMMMVLKRPNCECLSCQRFYPHDGRQGSSHGGVIRNRLMKRFTPYRERIGVRRRCSDRVDHQRDVAVLDVIDNMRTSFLNFMDGLDGQALLAKVSCGAGGGGHAKSKSRQSLGHIAGKGTILLFDADKRRAGGGKHGPGAGLRFHE